MHHLIKSTLQLLRLNWKTIIILMTICVTKTLTTNYIENYIIGMSI